MVTAAKTKTALFKIREMDDLLGQKKDGFVEEIMRTTVNLKQVTENRADRHQKSTSELLNFLSPLRRPQR